jgi:hypothetical protein
VKVTSFKTLALVVLATVFYAAADRAQAVPYFEQSDAGQSLATSQTVFGFNSISGGLQPDPLAPDPFDLVDLYRIFIISPTSFGADTGAGSDLTRIADPALFLLDFTGRGIVMDDDRDSTPPGSSGAQAHLGPLPSGSLPGFYFLGISFSGVYPLDTAGQFIFDPFAPQQPHTTPASSALALGSWDSTLFNSPNTTIARAYSIALAGVIPEPATVLLIVIALLALSRAQDVGHKRKPL